MSEEQLHLPIFDYVDFRHSPHSSVNQSCDNNLFADNFHLDWSSFEQTWYQNNLGILQQADNLLSNYFHAINSEEERKSSGRKRKRSKKKISKPSNSKTAPLKLKKEKEDDKLKENYIDNGISGTDVTYESTPIKGKPRPCYDDIIDDIDNVLDLIDPVNDIELNTIESDEKSIKNCEGKADFLRTDSSQFNGFTIWKKKFRQLVQEEYPEASDDELDDRMLDIWKQIPEAHRKKYDLKALEKELESASNIPCDTDRQKKNYVFESCDSPIVKPIPLKVLPPTCLDEQETVMEEKTTIDYQDYMKECPTFHSSDRWMKRRLESKRNASKTKIDAEDIYDENKIASGYLQDLMLNSVSDNNKNGDTDFPEIDMSVGLLKKDNAELEEMSRYLSQEYLSTQSKLDVDELASLIEASDGDLMTDNYSSVNNPMRVNYNRAHCVRFICITDMNEHLQKEFLKRNQA